jgi:hypothetical protein
MRPVALSRRDTTEAGRPGQAAWILLERRPGDSADGIVQGPSLSKAEGVT